MESSDYYSLSDNKLKNFTICAFTDLVDISNIEIVDGYKIKSYQGNMKKNIGSLKKGDYVEFNAEKDVIKILNFNLSFKVKFSNLIITDPSDKVKEINPHILQDHLETKFDVIDTINERRIFTSPKKELRALSPQFKYVMDIEQKGVKVYSWYSRNQIDSFSIIIPDPEIYQI